MSALPLQPREHLALSDGAVALTTNDTRINIGSLLGSGIIDGVGRVANVAGHTVRFATDVTVAGLKNLFRGFCRRSHS